VTLKQREPGLNALFLGGRAMNAHTRSAVAYIAAALANSRTYNTVYDYDQSREISFSGNVWAGNVKVYDHSEGCHISGCGTALYHEKDSSHIQLSVHGRNFSGYDHHTACLFSGTVSGSSVNLYEHNLSSCHKYQVG
jgi:hypothetical protein